jgi:hypothetical protein
MDLPGSWGYRQLRQRLDTAGSGPVRLIALSSRLDTPTHKWVGFFVQRELKEAEADMLWKEQAAFRCPAQSLVRLAVVKHRLPSRYR